MIGAASSAPTASEHVHELISVGRESVEGGVHRTAGARSRPGGVAREGEGAGGGMTPRTRCTDAELRGLSGTRGIGALMSFPPVWLGRSWRSLTGLPAAQGDAPRSPVAQRAFVEEQRQPRRGGKLSGRAKLRPAQGGGGVWHLRRSFELLTLSPWASDSTSSGRTQEFAAMASSAAPRRRGLRKTSCSSLMREDAGRGGCGPCGGRERRSLSATRETPGTEEGAGGSERARRPMAAETRPARSGVGLKEEGLGSMDDDDFAEGGGGGGGGGGGERSLPGPEMGGEDLSRARSLGVPLRNLYFPF